MKEKLKGILFYTPLFIMALIGVVGFIKIKGEVNQLKEEEEIIVKLEQPEFYRQSPKEGLKSALEYYEIPHSDIVYAQAVLETGNFMSNNCKNKNNLFGLYDSKHKKYLSFPHWIESVELYKKLFSDKYTDTTENYYQFLKRMNYAEDPLYESKLKKIISNS